MTDAEREILIRAMAVLDIAEGESPDTAKSLRDHARDLLKLLLVPHMAPTGTEG